MLSDTCFAKEAMQSPIIENVLDECRRTGKASPVIIKNCVATAYFGTSLDLAEISWKKYGEFNPTSFAAAKFRLRVPSTTALIFASGMVVCTGAASEESAFVAIMKYYQMVSEIVPQAVCLNIRIENIVGTAYIGYPINLKTISEKLQQIGCMNTIYDPELFPGLRLSIKDFNCTELAKKPNYVPVTTKVLLFSEGNVVICGAKKKEELAITWKLIRDLFISFQVEKVRSSVGTLARFVKFIFLSAQVGDKEEDAPNKPRKRPRRLC
jgi:transcription initiation factor TFIID TATA-box-binding protein